MRQTLPDLLLASRITSGPLARFRNWGPYGAFHVEGPCDETLLIVAFGSEWGDVTSNEWEHVSVSTRRRTPNWQEMCFVKDLFWDDEEAVIQYHPPKSEYVNNHEFCLHLWRPKDGRVPLPPSILVGHKDRGAITAEETAKLLRDNP